MEYLYRLRKNVWKNYMFVFLSRLDLTHGTWMIYLAMKGMSLVQLGIFESIFHVTSFFMEVPTGIVADLWGRKISRIWGRVFSVISTILLIVGDDFFIIALSFIISAISYNLESGAGEALIYDSLKELGEEKTYMKISGIREIFFQTGSVIGLFFGGYLATKGYTYAYGLSAIIGIASIIQAFTFTEPKIEIESSRKKSPLKDLWSQFTGSIKIIKSNKKLGFYIVFLQLIGVFATSLFFYLQNYLKNGGYNEAKIGLILALSSVGGAIVASQAHRIESMFKEKGIITVMPIIAAICIWGIALSKYHFIFYIVLVSVEAIIYVVISDYINRLIPSEKRATILSFTSMVFSMFMIIMFPLIGMIGDKYSLETAFKLMGLLATFLVVVNINITVKNNKRKLLQTKG